MRLSRKRVPLGLAAIALVASLLGACLDPGPVEGPPQKTADVTPPRVTADCPGILVLPGPFDIAFQDAAVAQFRPLVPRLRMEIAGDITVPGPSLASIGPCASLLPNSVSVVSATADVVLHGSNRSITTTGSALAWGAADFVVLPDEPGVVVGSD